MCGCEHHHDRARPCTCICPEHRNFEAAFALAMSRYDEILDLRAALAEEIRTRPTPCAVTFADHLAEAEQKGAREAAVLRSALGYIASPTMGLPPGRDAEEFVQSGDVNAAAGLYALQVCIRTAKAALDRTVPPEPLGGTQ